MWRLRSNGRGVRFPHGVKDHGGFPRDGDGGLLEADLLGEPQPPCLQRRKGDVPGEQGRRRLIEMFARHPVAVLGDTTIPAHLAGLVSSWRQAKIGPGARRAFEAAGLIEG